MPYKNIATMLLLLLLVIFTMCPLGTLDTVDVTNLVNLTGYVGETIELRCFDPSIADKFNLRKRDIKWMYLFKDDCSRIPSYVRVATCEDGDWEYLSYGHHLVGDDDSCDNGLADMRSKEPGKFTYKCELTTDHKTSEVITFVINVNAREHLPMSSCIAKPVPPTKILMFEFICTNYHRDCFNKSEHDKDFFIQHNGTRIIPDVSLGNKIIVRREIHNINSISQYYCITNNRSSPCVVDNVTLTNAIGITPLVNEVTMGSDVTYGCTLNNGSEDGVKYDWRLSRHIQVRRISGTASSTLKIHNVQLADDGVIVTCELDVNGNVFHSEALLKIIINSTSTVSTGFAKFSTDPMTTAWSSQSDLNRESNLEEALIIACSLLLISALFVIVIIVVNSTMQRRRKRTTDKSPNVQMAIGLTQPDDHPMSLGYSTELPPTPRKPSVVSLPLPLTPPPTSNSVISPVEMHVGLDESPQQQVALTEDGLLLSGLCQSAPLSPLLAATPYSSQIEHVTERETLPQCVTKPAASLSSKEAPRHTSIRSPLTSRTRKTSVTDQPLPVIPKSPLRSDEEEQGKGNNNTSPTSKELPVAVIKPTINEYSSIGDNQQGYGDSRENAITFNSLSAVLETHNDRHGNTRFDYTQEHLKKRFPDREAKSPDRGNNHSLQNSHVYAIPDEDTKGNVAGTSAKLIYHTIDQDGDTLFSSKGQYDGSTPAIGDSICSNHHIYELPEDEVATEENKHSASVETPFYFTLESAKNNESEDVATGHSTLHDPTTHISEKHHKSPISESEQYVQIAKRMKKKQISNVVSDRVRNDKNP